jgi:hypothetical protein
MLKLWFSQGSARVQPGFSRGVQPKFRQGSAKVQPGFSQSFARGGSARILLGLNSDSPKNQNDVVNQIMVSPATVKWYAMYVLVYVDGITC